MFFEAGSFLGVDSGEGKLVRPSPDGWLQPSACRASGISRGASIRLPVNFIKNGYKGYLEDRRPNSAADPYAIISRILKTIKTVPKSAMQSA